jgi:hypothetical protein
MFVVGEFVFRNLEIERRWPLPYASRDIVVRAVAWAEPASEIACFADGNATKMCTDSKHDQPLRLLHPVFIGLGISQRLPVGLLCVLNFVLRPMADEDWLASPFDKYL